MSGAASKAVDPYTQRRALLNFPPFLTKQLNSSHIEELCHIHSWAERILQSPILMKMGGIRNPLNIVFL